MKSFVFVDLSSGGSYCRRSVYTRIVK